MPHTQLPPTTTCHTPNYHQQQHATHPTTTTTDMPHTQLPPPATCHTPICRSINDTYGQARPDLNGEIGIALRFSEESGRWLVRLKGGEGKQLKVANLDPLGYGGLPLAECPRGIVHCVWGDAQWSRTQLLGEIARGHWGLCTASVAELVAPPAERRAALDGRVLPQPHRTPT